MRVTVHDEDGAFNHQTHAYAEYRVFAVLAAHSPAITDVTVTLTRTGDSGERVRCSIAAVLDSGDAVSAYGIGQYAYAAIDRAVELIAPRHGAGWQRAVLNGAAQEAS